MKLGPHCITPTAAALDWARHAPCVMALDDTTALKVAQPNALRCYRRFFPYQDIHADPQQVAGEILAGLGGYRHPRLYCQVFVGLSKEMIGPYIALLKQVVPILHAAGVKVAGPSLYSGDFDAATWAALRAADWAGLDLVVVQGYWASKGPTVWNALRYRQFWKPGDPPIFLGECGRDRVRDGDGGQYIGSPGWKTQGVAGVDYVTELLNFDLEIQADPYVWGAAVFTAGPTPDWGDFDTDGLNVAVLHSTPYLPGGDAVASDYAPATWRPVVNHEPRVGHVPVAVCFHRMAGYLANCYPEFNDPLKAKSAHYGIGKSGAVEQYVSESDAAWASGIWNKPNLSNPFLLDAFNDVPPTNSNQILVHIELEDFPGGEQSAMPAAQYQALLALVRSIFTRHNWPVGDSARYIRHSDIDSVNRATDPGLYLNLAQLKADMQAVPPKPAVDLRPEVARAEALAAAMVQLAADMRGKVGV